MRRLLLLLLLLPLTACSRLKIIVGLRISLPKTPIASIEASLPQGASIAPSQQSKMILKLTQPNGKILYTEGAGHGKVLWRDIAVQTEVVTASKGVIALAQDPRPTEGKVGHVAITIPSHPGLLSELTVPITYSYPFIANYSGANGSSGTDGTNGTAGSTGSSGSIDPNNPSPGGDGGNGTDGTNGTDGGNGGDGPDVQVRATLRPGPHPMLQFSVSAKGLAETFYLVDPQGGTISIYSLGGAGGSGGRGGSGGQGGSGGTGSPSGSAGRSGSDGSSGSNGVDGSPGAITITYDPSMAQFLGVIRAQPVATFTTASIPPLW